MRIITFAIALLSSFAASAGSLVVQFNHPQLTIERTLSIVDDDKMVEFADLLIQNYGPDENGDLLSRSAAVTRFADSMLQASRDAYRRMKLDTARAEIVTVEIDD